MLELYNSLLWTHKREKFVHGCKYTMYKKGIKETQNKPMETTMGMVNPSWKYVESYMYSQLVIRSTGRGSRAGISWVIPSKVKAIKSFYSPKVFLYWQVKNCNLQIGKNIASNRLRTISNTISLADLNEQFLSIFKYFMLF